MAQNTHPDLIVLGASAGGLDVLRTITGGLPVDLQAAVVVVMHLSPDSPNVLARILERESGFPIRSAADRDRVEYGSALVAPPDHHITFEDGVVRVRRGPRENAHRPSIDVTMRSAAGMFGPRVVGVILTGGLNDGTDGMRAVKRAGGCTVVQDPREAENQSMPRSAIAHVKVDQVVKSVDIAGVLVEITKTAACNGEVQSMADVDAREKPSKASEFVCPECSGTLFETKEDDWSTYRCRVGHAYTTESLILNKSSSLEAAMWTASRALREQADLFTRVGMRLAPARDTTRRRFVARAAEARVQSRLIENAILKLQEHSLEADLDEVN